MSSIMTQSFRRSILSSQLVTRKVLLSQPQKFAINSNPALFKSSLLRTYTNSTSPLPSPQEDSSSSSHLSKFAIRLPAVIIAKLVMAGVIGLISVDLIYAGYRNRCNKRLLYKTVEKGTRPEIDVSDIEFTPRPLVVDRLKKIFQPSRNQSYYHVVCGEHGTGKTTLARIASREVGQGVVYVEIPTDPKDKDIELFGIAFGESLNFRFEEHISFTGQLMKKLLGDNGKDGRPKWRRALEAFKNAGAVYKKKHNKLPVIIYDNISEIMTVDPEVLDALQNDAKMNADRRNYVAVFVSSEGSVPRRMESRSSWSRADKPVMEIGDLSEEESMKYLTEKRKIKEEEAKRLYELVGGRIVELKSVADKLLSGKKFEVIKKQVFGAAYDNLEKAGVNPGQDNHEAAKIIIRFLLNSKDMLHVSMLREMTKVEPNKLLEGNVFAYHPENKAVTFQSRSIECYIRANADKFN